jgi:hypothetical protein
MLSDELKSAVQHSSFLIPRSSFRREQGAKGVELGCVEFRKGFGLPVDLLWIGGNQLSEPVDSKKGAG